MEKKVARKIGFQSKLQKIQDSHSSDYKKYSLLGYDTMYFGINLQISIRLHSFAYWISNVIMFY